MFTVKNYKQPLDEARQGKMCRSHRSDSSARQQASGGGQRLADNQTSGNDDNQGIGRAPVTHKEVVGHRDTTWTIGVQDETTGACWDMKSLPVAQPISKRDHRQAPSWQWRKMGSKAAAVAKIDPPRCGALWTISTSHITTEGRRLTRNFDKLRLTVEILLTTVKMFQIEC